MSDPVPDRRFPGAYRLAPGAYRLASSVLRAVRSVTRLAQRRALANLDVYHQFPPAVLSASAEKRAKFHDALRAYASVSLKDEASALYSDPIRVLNFFQAIEAANRLPPGDYIELGSHRGYSLRVIHRFMDPAQTLYSLDTFEGFHETDIAVEQQHYDAPWTKGNFAPTSVEGVARYVGDGTWPANLKIVKGWFPDSFRGLEDRRWRFAHIDFDLYQPIKAALETIWRPLLPGGVIMVHDYGSHGFPAARKAVDEFCAVVGVLPLVLPDRWSTAILRKPLGVVSLHQATAGADGDAVTAAAAA